MMLHTRLVSSAVVLAFAALAATACSDVGAGPSAVLQPAGARASGGPAGGGGGGGGGGVVVPATGFGGSWSGTIVDPNLGAGLFTMQLSVVGTSIRGNLRAGAPIFDSGFSMSGTLTSPTTMDGLIARSHGFIEVTGTLSDDETTITGVFYSNGPNPLPFTVTRQ